MIKMSSTKLLGTIGVAGIIIGIGLIVLARYMLTNYAYSVSQTHRSHAVRGLGLLMLTIGITSIIINVVKVSARQARKQ